jgi:GAF domain-containing protein
MLSGGIGASPHDFVGLLGLIGTQGHPRAWPVDRVRQFGDRTQRQTPMPIDPSMLAKSIGTLTDLDPQRDLAATLQQAVQGAKSLFDADAAGVMLVDTDGSLRWASASDHRAQVLEDNQEVFAAGPCMEAYTSGRPAVMHDATMERRWGEITLTMVEVQIRSGLSVPVELGGGPIGTLDVYAVDPRGWDQSEVTALQAYAGVVASLLGAAAKAELTGALAEQLQVALESRGLIERAKGALMERERLDDQEAFTHLRRAARSSGRKLSEVAAEVAAGQPLPRGRTKPTRTEADQPKSDAGDPQQEA